MEIKQSILTPFGSKEEMGGGTSAWTYGRGVIGSPGAEPPPPAALVGPTTNWLINMGPMYFPEITVLPSELNTPSNYKLVLSGGASAGEWPITQAYIQPMSPNILVIGFGMGDRPFPGSTGRIEGSDYTPPPGPPPGGAPALVDSGIATIVPV